MPTSWLSLLIKDVVVDGVQQPTRGKLALVAGAGVDLSVTDSENDDTTTVTLAATGGAGVAGEDWFPSAKAATAGALPAYTRTLDTIDANANGAFPAIDGVTINVGEDFVLQHGASHVDDGIYTLTAAGSGGSAWSATRRADFASESTVTSQARIPIEQGATYGGRVLKLAVNDPIVVNVTTLSFAVDTGLPNGTVVDQTLKWSGSTWIAGALNLAAAAAVTGVLGVANGGTGIGLGAANTVLRVNAGATAIESAKLVAANLDAAAGIAATQLAAGGAGNVLLGGASNSWGQVTTSQISATAAIAATQLAPGGANTVLWSNGSANSWTGSPTVTSLAASSYLASGGTVATSGELRLAHGATVQGRNSANSANRVALSWGSVATDTVGLGDAAALTRITGSAVHAYAGATQTAQLGLATGDFVKMGDVPASTGNLRVDDSWTLYQRNGNPGTADRAVLTCSGEGVQLGSTAQTGNTIIDGNLVYIRTAGSVRSLVTTAEWQMTLATLSFAGTLGASNVVHHPPAGDVLAGPFTVRAQSAWASASTNKDGAHLLLQGGAEKGAAAGKKGGVRLQLNGTTETMLEVTEVAIGRRVVASCRAADLTTTQMPANSGDLVEYQGTCATTPTAAPDGGCTRYVDSNGNLWVVNEANVHTQLTP